RVKAAFENVFKAMVDVLSREVKRSAQPSETAALAIASLCIGGMLVARSLNDPRFADCLREAATSAALAMGGWKQPKSRKRSTAAR
ncbi:MAG TPA: hypothetical protein VKG79_16370, partial [Bryobacteraceae bacterium]|nr:hypothetical protein [Bryobacteraceae bacterium]